MSDVAIIGEVILNGHNAANLPKQVDLFDQKLNKISSQWIFEKSFEFKNLRPGTYVIRVQLGSGQREEVVVIAKDIITKVNIILRMPLLRRIGKVKYPEAPLTKTFNRRNDFKEISLGSYLHNNIRSLHFRLWISDINNRDWYPNDTIGRFVRDKGPDCITLNLKTEDYNSFLEINGKGFNTYRVSLPPGNQLEIDISPAYQTTTTSKTLQIDVSTKNLRSETLLTLITKGAINDAQILTNATDAENLLFEKKRDAAAAAVGGYFLLKTGELQRMHNWANNLANWFPWMSDGLIIHAWQMIQDQDREKNLGLIKERLITAAFGKPPVYTEGLRLLIEGLNQLACIPKYKDESVLQACRQIKNLKTQIDWSQKTTTLMFEPKDGDNNRFGFYNDLNY